MEMENWNLKKNYRPNFRMSRCRMSKMIINTIKTLKLI